MTIQECSVGMDRLGKAWNVRISKEQVASIHERIKHIPGAAWTVAINDLVANYLQAPRSGFLNAILKAADDVMESQRQTRLRKERDAADKVWAHGYQPDKGRSAQDTAYGSMRLMAIKNALSSDGHYAETMRDELLAWVNDPKHAAWAKTQVMAPFPGYDEIRNLLDQLVIEIQRWDDRAKSKVAQTAPAQ